MENQESKVIILDVMPIAIGLMAVGAAIGNLVPNKGLTTGERAMTSGITGLAFAAGGIGAHYALKGIGALWNRFRTSAPSVPVSVAH